GMGTGGMGGGIVCNNDNRCGWNLPPDREYCSCGDCWTRDACNVQSSCNNDGVCEQPEGCFCEDCKDEPQCEGYCISCEELTTYYSAETALCANSAPIFQDLEACACNACASDCDINFCSGIAPSGACDTCIQDMCLTQFTACRADKLLRVKCNPITTEGCIPQNARCDRLRFSDLPANGFECHLGVDNDVCEGCQYTMQQGGCKRGTSCLDSVGELTDEMGTCGKYCCDDNDCGTGTCVKGLFLADIGICYQAGGAGGGGGSTPSNMLECMPTEPPPSMGSCVTVP
ncbi:MAG: hypothetical protein KC731_11285, partial [Myxococcales bacterium]|nr:hypothetical protein [Myxococcales bacterium]